jgi:hypothetical protein
MKHPSAHPPASPPGGWFTRALSGAFRVFAALFCGAGLLQFCGFSVFLYLAYRALACGRWGWECRVKTARMNLEDLFALLLLSTAAFYVGGFDPLPGGPFLAHRSDPASSEEDVELPLGSGARSTWATLRSWVTLRGALRFAGSSAAVTAAFVMGAAGVSVREDVTGVPLGILVPLLAVVAVAVAYSAAVSARKAGAAAGFLVRVLGVGAFWGLAAAVAGRRGASGGKGCAALTFHAHHWALACSACSLLYEHGLPPPFRASWQRAQLVCGTLVWLTKNALLGIAVHGLAQYGPDSLLRTTTCATSR